MTENLSPRPQPRWALVTGAAGIIGPAIVATLRARGWRVAATDRSLASFELHEKALGERCAADRLLPADLGSQSECAALIETIACECGELGAIVNGAAFNNPLSLAAMQEEALQRSFAVNFAAPLYLAQAALPMLSKNKGAIVNLSSVMVTQLKKNNMLYACSKAALEAATTIMGLEMVGVRVNAIRIGRVPGHAFLRRVIPHLDAEAAQKMVRDIHARRMDELTKNLGEQAIGAPEDIAHMVAFLLSEEARFLNGRTFTLDGGYEPESPMSGTSFADLIADWMAQNGYESDGGVPRLAAGKALS